MPKDRRRSGRDKKDRYDFYGIYKPTHRGGDRKTRKDDRDRKSDRKRKGGRRTKRRC